MQLSTNVTTCHIKKSLDQIHCFPVIFIPSGFVTIHINSHKITLKLEWIEQWYISVTSPWNGKFLETQYIKCQPNNFHIKGRD